MTFEQLLYVEVLSHYNSLQKAADALHISKPGLSLAIKDLENELGVKIFERTSKGSVLTKDGMRMLGVISEILKSRSSLERLAVFANENKKKESIRIRYINTLFEAFMIPFVSEYGKRYADVYYEITRGEMKDIIAQVRSCEIDAGFVASSDIESEWIRDLRFQPVCYSKIVLMVSKENELLSKDVTLEDLKKQKFCLYDDQSHQVLFDRMQYLCGPLDLVFKSDDHWAIVQAVSKLNMVTFARNAQGFYSHEETDDSIASINIGHLVNDNVVLGWLSSPRAEISDTARQMIQDITKLIAQKSV